MCKLRRITHQLNIKPFSLTNLAKSQNVWTPMLNLRVIRPTSRVAKIHKNKFHSYINLYHSLCKFCRRQIKYVLSCLSYITDFAADANCFVWKQFAWNVQAYFLGKMIKKLFQNVVYWRFYPSCWAWFQLVFITQTLYNVRPPWPWFWSGSPERLGEQD